MFPTQKKMKVFKKGTAIDIFKPCNFSDNFIHYHFVKIDSDGDNMHQWRMFHIYVADKELNDTVRIAFEVEWEGAILEEGAKDFMGGYHGDENNISFSILADTRLYSPDDDFEIECNYLKLCTVSYLDRCNTPGDRVFLRNKNLIFDQNGYTIDNHYELLQDLQINRFENIMMGMPLVAGEKRFVEYAASNTHPNPVFISLDSSENADNPIFRGDKNATSYEVFAPNFNFYGKVEGFFDKEKYPNGFRVADNWRVRSDKTFKAYFNMTGKYAGKKGEIFRSKAVYTLEG